MLRYTLYICVLLSSLFVSAQKSFKAPEAGLHDPNRINSSFVSDRDPSRESIKSDYKLFAGGNLGLSFGTVTNIDISPMLGYYFTPYLSAGIGATYQYISDRSYVPVYDPIRLNIFGGRAFARVHPINQLFGYIEYEYLTYASSYILFPNIPEGERLSSVGILVGAGYKENLNSNLAAFFMVLWNLNESIYTPYFNPVIRAGFEVGLDSFVPARHKKPITSGGYE